MGMGEDFLIEKYPPQNFQEALALSKSPAVEALYREGELAGFYNVRLREELLPFPGGQLAAFAHMGRYADNIQRYVDLFGPERLVCIETKDLCNLGAVARRIGTLVPAVCELQDNSGIRDAGDASS